VTDLADEGVAECGVPVTTRAQGHIIVRTFPGEGTGVAEVRTINVSLTATAGGRVFRFRDVGADVTRIEPDGTAVLSITGQVPFAFAGVLKIDLETGAGTCLARLCSRRRGAGMPSALKPCRHPSRRSRSR
jgi:hypothetical protein